MTGSITVTIIWITTSTQIQIQTSKLSWSSLLILNKLTLKGLSSRMETKNLKLTQRVFKWERSRRWKERGAKKSYLICLQLWCGWGKRERSSPLHCRRQCCPQIWEDLARDAHGCVPPAPCMALTTHAHTLITTVTSVSVKYQRHFNSKTMPPAISACVQNWQGYPQEQWTACFCHYPGDLHITALIQRFKTNTTL